MATYILRHIQSGVTVSIGTSATGIRCGAGGIYAGFCDFDVTNGTITVHSISAQPAGSRLGAALLMVTALEGAQQGATRIETQATATSAIPFYLGAGFLPRNPFNNGQSSYNLGDAAERNDFAMRVLGRYYAATWEASTSTMLRRVDAQMDGHWEIESMSP